MKESLLRKAMAEIGRRGGQANTQAQKAARKENAAKARAARLAKK